MKLFFRKLGSGPPLVILHGFLGTSDNWITVGKDLSKKYTVYLVDQRNHGLSPHADSNTLFDMAADLKEFLVANVISDPILMGHSMGGKVLIKFAQQYRGDFESLIIVDISPKYYPPHHAEIFKGLRSIDLPKIKDRKDVDDKLSFYIKEFSVRQFLLKNLNRIDGSFSWKANLPVLEAAMTDIGESLESDYVSDRPVYFIRGENSNYVEREDRNSIKKMFPIAKILTIKNAGHWVHAENQSAFLSTIKSLLEY